MLHQTSVFSALRTYKVIITAVPTTIKGRNCSFDFLRLLKILPVFQYVCAQVNSGCFSKLRHTPAKSHSWRQGKHWALHLGNRYLVLLKLFASRFLYIFLHLPFQHIVSQGVWKNARPLHLSLPLYSGFREWKPRQALCGQSEVIPESVFLLAASWLAVETSDVPYVLILASGHLTSWVQVTPSASSSRAETDQFTQLQLFLQRFQLVVNL